MIHLIPLDDFPATVTDQVCRRLYMAFAIGCEVDVVEAPGDGARGEDGRWRATALLEEGPRPRHWRDDRLLYLVAPAVEVPEGPLGAPPSPGYARPDLGAAVVSADGLERPDAPADDADGWSGFADRLARRAVHQMGFLWGLHRCVDPKCAMYVPWSPEVARANAEGQPTLCTFCREKSETRLKRSRS